MKLALFDFDGTITTKDTLVDFIQYVKGKPAYYFGLLKLSPILLAYLFKIIPNHIAKEKLIIHFFKDWDIEYFQKIANQYSTIHIDKIIRHQAIKKIIWHQKKGHEVVIVSASMENWLSKWCQKNNLDLISTRLEVINGKITGKFTTKNCYGIEKVNRIKEKYDLTKYNFIYAYGDSPGDKQMLLLANSQNYKKF